MPGTQQKALLECCECKCQGCCVPVDESNVVQEIPFEISAPNCPDLDGVTGFFVPIDTVVPSGVCGPCPTYCVVATLFVSGRQTSGTENPGSPGGCLYTPCSIPELCLMLECPSSGAPATGLDECCGRLRLWIGSAIPWNDESPDAPESGSCDGFTECTSWRKLSPSTCTCEGGLSGEFDLSVLSLYCDPGDVWGSPNPCEGLPKCCQLDCDLTDAVLVI